MSKTDESAKPNRSGQVARLVVLLLLVAGVIALFRYGSVGEYFTQEYLQSLLEKFGFWQSALLFVIFYAVATMLAVPGTILTVMGGVIFGSLVGTLLIVTGATIGASGAFFISRFFARDFIADKFAGKAWFIKLEKGVEEEGLYFVLFMRLVPIFPFNGINFATGLTNVKFKDYLIGTFVGIAPATFAFAHAASSAAEAAEKGISAGFFVSLALLGLIALVPIFYKRWKKKKPDNQN